jgi:hypothetical protein
MQYNFFLTTALVAAVLATINIANAQGEDTPPNARLNIVGGGMATNGLALMSEALRYKPTTHQFHVQFVGPQRRAEEALLGKGLIWHLKNRSEPPGVVPIRIETSEPNSLNDPKVRDRLSALAKYDSVTINFDMNVDIPWSGLARNQVAQPLFAKAEKEATYHLTLPAIFVAEEFKKHHPKGETRALFHSWGTTATPVINKYEQDLGRRVIQDQIIAAPVVPPSKVAGYVNVIMTQSDAVTQFAAAAMSATFKHSEYVDPQLWAQNHNVIQVRTTGVSITSLGSLDYYKTTLGYHTLAYETLTGDRRADVNVWLRGAVKPIETSDVTPSRVLGVLDRASGAAGGRGAADNVKALLPFNEVLHREIMSDIRRAREISKLQIPCSCGGISLTVPAIMPFERGAVFRAHYDTASKALVLTDRAGAAWRLPPMDPELIAVAYYALFEKKIRPELSIGSRSPGNNFVGGRTGARAGVYYSRGIQNTRLGYIMLRADISLGELAYTRNPKVRQLFPEFRSLPELYPQKYATNAGDDRFLGSEDRILLQTGDIELVPGRSRELRFRAGRELVMRFGNTGPAEMAFGAWFGNNFEAIVAALPELRELRDAARVVAVIAWLSENQVQFDKGPMASLHESDVVTPDHVAPRRNPTVEDLERDPPLAPQHIIHGEGRVTNFEYEGPRVRRIRRWDGEILTVFYADDGRVVGLSGDGDRAAVVDYGGMSPLAQIIDNVVLDRSGDGNVAFTAKPESVLLLEARPNAVIYGMIEGFARARP